MAEIPELSTWSSPIPPSIAGGTSEGDTSSVHERLHEPNFKQLPPEWTWVRSQLIEASRDPDFAAKYGLTNEADSILVFHGTQRDKASTISSEGVKAFEETPNRKPRIFVTASPTMALYHAIERGPHDTLRARGRVGHVHKPEEALLLAIRVPRGWLAAQPQAQLPMDTPEWVKKMRGITPEQDNRLWGFNRALTQEVLSLQQGNEVDDFGVTFPVDHIPSENVAVIESDAVQPLFESLSSQGV